MSRKRVKLPGRYQRPANMRAPLGDFLGEADIQQAHRAGVLRRIAAEQRARGPYAVGGVCDRAVVATVEESAVLDRPAGELSLREATESAITEAPGADGQVGRLVPVIVIRSGWNSSSSRYYDAAVLERDVPKVYPAGTQCYIDHPRISEQDDIPERSLTTLAGEFVDDPWPVREADGTLTMRTNVRVYAPWQPLIRDAWRTIGLSINGTGRGEYGTREGRDGTIIEELTSGRSVDFVTVPGAGGRILGLLESHQPFSSPEFRAWIDEIVATREAGTLGAYVESRIHLGFTQMADDLYAAGRLTRDERITLSGAIGDGLAAFIARIDKDAPQIYQRSRWDGPDDDTAGGVDTEEAARVRTREASVEQWRAALNTAVDAAHGGNDNVCWVDDFDPDRGLVWFWAPDVPAPTTPGTPVGRGCLWQQSYITSGGTAALTGTRIEVRRTTVYVPVPDDGDVDGPAVDTTETTAGSLPAGSNPGPSVPDTTKESDMGEKSPEVVAREAAEARLADEIRTREASDLKLARYEAADTARPIIEGLLTESGLPQPACQRVRADFTTDRLPLIEATRQLDETTLRQRAAAAITAEKAYMASLLEAAGAGTVRGNGPAAGAGAGAPAGYTTGTTTTTESFFGLSGGGQVQLSEADRAAATAADEQLINLFVARGLTREAAVLALADY